MTADEWDALHKWLVAMFGPDDGADMFAEHVDEARRSGLDLPQQGES